ncbi:MAG: deoxyguanosinetriphosphate triphosphohydrolase [Clostridiales bacterium]|nr:deoxyguanosinetriphosphate triphosphohydrolase [Clostridiales bacterium]
MTLRERREQAERYILRSDATFSADCKGRERYEAPCEVRTEFQRDRDRIVHSKAFRRLKDKTQVFIGAEDHFRVRLTHTLEVMQIARTIARALMLNEDLTEAIAMGHDLGHTPFGHAGERALDRLAPCGFAHNEQSIRVVKLLEKDGRGLNLTYEVMDGILNHRTRLNAATPEGNVVRLSDKIAYINHDIDDALGRGDLTLSDIPADCLKVLGHSRAQRIDTMVKNVIQSSESEIRMTGEVDAATQKMRRFLFDTVYMTGEKKQREDRAELLIEQLFHYYMKNKGAMPEEYEALAERFGRDRGVCDYIAGMTDNYAIRKFNGIYHP